MLLCLFLFFRPLICHIPPPLDAPLTFLLLPSFLLSRFIAKTRERWWNGYLLFYERVEDEAGPAASAAATAAATATTAAAGETGSFSVPQPLGMPSDSVYRKVQEENLKFYHHRYLFSAEYFEFFKNLCAANGAWLTSVKDSSDANVASARTVIGALDFV